MMKKKRGSNEKLTFSCGLSLNFDFPWKIICLNAHKLYKFINNHI